ncbi:MAG: lactonase family protein [Longimicrobiaceae bacterium]
MRKWLALPALALSLGLGACDGLFGLGDDANDGALYTMTNAAGANHVLVFSRGDDGRLTFRDSVSTGGAGSGPDPVFGTDPLTSQDAVILSDDHRFLFVVNAGSNEISSFRVGNDGMLTLANKVSSGGTFPVSLSARSTLLYVVNANNGGNISGFSIGSDGTLTPIAGSTRPLSGAAVPGPGSIRISPNGQTIVVTEKPTNLLDIYAIGSNGVATGPTVVGASGPTPFGADFAPSGPYIVSLGNIGPNRMAVPDGSGAGSLVFTAPTTPSTVSGFVPTTETAACWVQITPDGRFAYTTNTASGSITGFSIATNGALTPLTGDGKTGVTGPNTQPLDMAFADGYLYALTAGDRGVHVFRVSSNGALTARNELDVIGFFPVSVTGLAAY